MSTCLPDLELAIAPGADDGCGGEGGGGDADQPSARAASDEQIGGPAARSAVTGLLFGVPPERHRLGEGGDLDGVAAGGGLRDGGDGPVNPLIVFDGDAEFFGAGLVLLVVGACGVPALRGMVAVSALAAVTRRTRR